MAGMPAFAAGVTVHDIWAELYTHLPRSVWFYPKTSLSHRLEATSQPELRECGVGVSPPERRRRSCLQIRSCFKVRMNPQCFCVLNLLEENLWSWRSATRSKRSRSVRATSSLRDKRSCGHGVPALLSSKESLMGQILAKCPNPECEKTYPVSEELAGQVMHCTQCGVDFKAGARSGPDAPLPESDAAD